MSRGVALVALLCALLAGCGGSSGDGGGTATGSADGRFAAADSLPEGLAGRAAPAIALTDAGSGRTLDTATLRGTPYLVTFLYTNCPDVCPLIGQEIRQSLEQLGGQRREVAVVAVSVDPRGDTREAVQVWLRRQRQPAQFHYLIGSEQQLEPVWRAFYAAPQIAGRPDSAHTAVIWLVDGDGRLAGKISAGLSFEPADLTADLRTLLSERDGR
ncbi:SCO family protein [Conexibacter sp. JD483]|uniref:SCO family protein n=1 Tax=unclassified Conexibacter TaxID=2627773 RepID=UPI00271C6E0A|nr:MULTISPECIES: SCO family protein [unclassified Conexibacter]MDO8189185.1 SCO family protein [Conexibacter sp. CPCC 205706]MDO8201918.1 SCO family protein [Conexibacter sp. CPCC 205762]MDR9371951.1 SCO family protein [Conexibacter sp. JD483]